jgi:hypothetical protein
VRLVNWVSGNMDDVTLGIDYRLLNLGYGHKVYKHVVAISYVLQPTVRPGQFTNVFAAMCP